MFSFSEEPFVVIFDVQQLVSGVQRIHLKYLYYNLIAMEALGNTSFI